MFAASIHMYNNLLTVLVIIMPKLQKREYTQGKSKTISFFLTLPKDYVVKLGWKEQDHILVRLTEDNNRLILEKA